MVTITTLAQLKSGLKPPLTHNKQGPNGSGAFYINNNGFASGVPAAQVACSAGLAGEALSTPWAGSLAFQNPPGGQETRLARVALRGLSAASLFLLIVDRLWQNSGLSVTSTASQAVNSVAWPARDINASTNGDGVFVMLETSGNMGSGSPTVTLGYTSSGGTAGRAAGLITNTTGSTQSTGTGYVFGLQAGDTGVQSIQSFQLSATMTSGALQLVAFRPVALIPISDKATVPKYGWRFSVEDALTLAAPLLHNDSVIQIWNAWDGNTGQPGALGSLAYSQG